MLRLHMAKLLVKAREFGDESVTDVAQRTGISRSTLHRLAAGTKQPSLATLWTLRGAYGVRLDTLVYDDPRALRSTPVRPVRADGLPGAGPAPRPAARATSAHREPTTPYPLHDPGADH
ncbi:helix-turn-helix domain-containing protein [Streptomyces sp. NPDC001083]|uniref:helix-turn-helix domain-containing protein n=1 Tax=Streptomyces sp. NPDC001083 TaxID=3364545 RepID=UPI0036C78499